MELKTDKVDFKKHSDFFLHIFSIHSSSRHEKHCRMPERIFCQFQCSRNIGWIVSLNFVKMLQRAKGKRWKLIGLSGTPWFVWVASWTNIFMINQLSCLSKEVLIYLIWFNAIYRKNKTEMPCFVGAAQQLSAVWKYTVVIR